MDPSDNEGIELSPWHKMVIALADLAVTAGLMASVTSQMPEHVQSNFEEKLGDIEVGARALAEEITQFGEAFDNPTQDDEH